MTIIALVACILNIVMAIWYFKEDFITSAVSKCIQAIFWGILVFIKIGY